MKTRKKLAPVEAAPVDDVELVSNVLAYSRENALQTFRQLVEAGFLRSLRTREPAWSLGYAARAADMSAVRLSEIERGNGGFITDDELKALDAAFFPRSRTVVKCASTTVEQT